MKGTMTPLVLLIALAIVATIATGISTATEITESTEKFYKNLNKENLVLTKLKYYIHAHFGTGPDQTVFQVASAKITQSSPTTFGRILIVDNRLTLSPDPKSEYVGQYQGMNAYSDFQESSANMNMNIIFSNKKYNGSTISILGRQPVNQEVRVLSVIGGTGVFRLARGTVLARTYNVDPATKIGVYVYDMYVVTPKVGNSRSEA